jgi:hypothetical protein
MAKTVQTIRSYLRIGNLGDLLRLYTESFAFYGMKCSAAQRLFEKHSQIYWSGLCRKRGDDLDQEEPLKLQSLKRSPHQVSRFKFLRSYPLFSSC